MSSTQQKQAIVAGAAVIVAGTAIVVGYRNRDKLPALPKPVATAADRVSAAVFSTAQCVQKTVSNGCTATCNAAASARDTVASYLPGRSRKLQRVKSFPLVEDSLEEETPSTGKKGKGQKGVGVAVTAR